MQVTNQCKKCNVKLSSLFIYKLLGKQCVGYNELLNQSDKFIAGGREEMITTYLCSLTYHLNSQHLKLQ